MNTKFSWRKKNVPTVYIYFNFDKKNRIFPFTNKLLFDQEKKVVALGIFKYAKKTLC